MDPDNARAIIGKHVPDKYKGMYDSANSAADKAIELKKKKDALQLKAFEKVIDPLWKKVDKEGKGIIDHE